MLPPKKVYDTGLLYHHYANTAYPLTPSSFMEFKLRDEDAIKALMAREWNAAREFCLYVHIPFCQTRCRFCEYTVLENATEEDQNEYADLLLAEMAMYRELLGKTPVVGYDIGGGTPMHLSTRNLARITEAAFSLFAFAEGVECSIETTPAIAAKTPGKLAEALRLGYGRISMGVQTVSPRLLEELGREGGGSLYERAVANIREAGFTRFNIDLMYGFLNQSDSDLESTLHYAVALQPDFITLYRNRYKGTKLEGEAGGVSLYKAMRQYQLAYRTLIANGYHANIGKNTFSRDPADYGTSDYLTKRVIQGTPYLGLGLGAQSFGLNYLAYNEGAASKKLDRYRDAIGRGSLPLQDIYDLPLDEAVAKMTSVAFYFGFIDLPAFHDRFGVSLEQMFPEEMRFVVDKGLMTMEGQRLTLTERGANYINGVIPLFYSQRSKDELIRLYEKRGHASDDEAVFLTTYNPGDYDRPSVASDVVALTLRPEPEPDSYRKPASSRLAVLLIKRGEHPYMNCWALPGGFLRRGEEMEHCAQRELFEESGLSTETLLPLGCFSAPNRDPRGWIISNAFLSIVAREDNELTLFSGDDAIDAEWFTLTHRREGDRLLLELEGSETTISAILRVIVTPFGEPRYEILPAPTPTEARLAFDHAAIIATAIGRLQTELGQRNPLFAFLPAEFTLLELQSLHEAILDEKLLTANFRRKNMPMVEEIGDVVRGAGHRPARLYRRRQDSAE